MHFLRTLRQLSPPRVSCSSSMVPSTYKPTELPWSPLGPLLANVFMSSLEEKLEPEGKLPDYHRRYVDDTLTIMRNITRARTS